MIVWGGVDLSGAKLRQLDLQKANLAGANLSQADLDRVNLGLQT
jgi:uncharacterized protein YjbI with pentapeptide repeats